jgi:hypothetical protein
LGGGGIPPPRFIMSVGTIITKINLMLLSLMLIGGCAVYSSNIHDVKNLNNIRDIKHTFNNIDCHEIGLFQKCTYQEEYFNVLELKHSIRIFNFLINKQGDIVQKNLKESSTNFHIIPTSGLPDAFLDFK